MKLEFSKKIFVVVATLAIAVVIFACYMIYKTENLEPLTPLLTSVGAIAATGIGFYYSKAKLENKIKLMKSNGVKPTEETFNDTSYEDVE